MVKQTMYCVAIKLCVEVAVPICFERLVVADLVLVVLANDTDFGSGDWLGPSQRPCSSGLTALAVNYSFDHHLNFLLRMSSRDGREGQLDDHERCEEDQEPAACHFLEWGNPGREREGGGGALGDF